ncbi:MAG: hypothetical protein H8E98_05660 [Bacteroidetes bacterium]|nr:hypothetical protein [Bacteroidota bacterium]
MIEYNWGLEKFDLRNSINIALTPESMWALERKGVKYYIPQNFLPENSSFKQNSVCINLVEKFAGCMDNMVRTCSEKFNKDDFRPFEQLLYLWQITFDSFLLTIYEIDTIIKKIIPEKVCWINAGVKTDYLKHLLFHQSPISLYQEILSFSDFQARYRFSFEQIDHTLTNKSANISRQQNGDISSGTVKLKKFIEKKCFTLAKQIIRLRPTAKLLLCSGISMDNKIFKALLLKYKTNIGILDYGKILSIYNSHIGSSDYSDIMKDSKNRNLIDSVLVFHDIKIYGLMENCVIGFLNTLDNYFSVYCYLKDLLLKMNVSAVMSPTFLPTGFVFFPMMADICRKNKIKTITYLHGGEGNIEAPRCHRYGDIKYSDYYLVYGEGVCQYVKYVNSKYFSQKYPVIPVNTGCKFSNIPVSKKGNGKEKYVVYVPTIPANNSRLSNYDDPDVDDTTMWKLQMNLIDVLAEFQEKYRIVIKLIPDDSLNKWELFEDYLCAKEYNKLIVEHNKGFEAYIDRADLFIFDNPAYTSFFQTCHTDRDIFWYSRAKYTEVAESMMSRRCYFYKNHEEFCTELASYLKNGVFCTRQDMDFAREFIDSESSTSYANRVVDFFSKNLDA